MTNTKLQQIEKFIDEFFTEKKTMMDVFQKCVDNCGEQPALRIERPCPKLEKPGVAEKSEPLEKWKTWTYNQYSTESKLAAQAFTKLGLEKGDGVNVLAFNSPEWFISYIGCIMAGGLIGGLYATDSKDILTYKCNLGGCRVVCVDNEASFKKLIDVAGDITSMKAIVYWGFETDVTTAGNDAKVISWEALLELGKKENDEDKIEEVLAERMSSQKPDDACVLVFTSGTTGMPKAVQISHDNIVYEGMCVHKNLPKIGTTTSERVISYLPLSHVAGMLVDIILPIFVGCAAGGNYMSTYFARDYDLKAGTIGDRLRAVQPTMFFGVPRVWEKIMEKMLAIGASKGAVAQTIGGWAKGKGLEHTGSKQFGKKHVTPWGFGVANAIAFSKVKEALGLQHCQYALTGAAPMQAQCRKYFASLTINILEVYGMSESCGASLISADDGFIWGSPGRALYGTETKIFKVDEATGAKTECPPAKDPSKPTEEEQGEICMNGRNIMLGYHSNPALGEEHVAEIAKKNKETVDEEGWLHSGDKGCIDKDGFVYITGRYKEIIIGAGGENIAPIPVEDAFKMYCNAISNVIMVGDQQKYNVALVTLKAEGATGEFAGTDKLMPAAANFCSEKVSTIQEAIESKAFIDAMISSLKKTNSDTSVIISNPHKIQKFTILPRDLSIENGEFTTTLKTKRSVVAKIHEDAIAKLYADESGAIFVPYPKTENTTAGGN
eukprot:Awhi_evm1s10867